MLELYFFGSRSSDRGCLIEVGAGLLESRRPFVPRMFLAADVETVGVPRQIDRQHRCPYCTSAGL